MEEGLDEFGWDPDGVTELGGHDCTEHGNVTGFARASRHRAEPGHRVLIHLGPNMCLKPNLGANGLDDPHCQGDQSFVPRGLSAVLVFCGHGDTSRVYSVDGHMGSLWILRKLIDRANGHRL